MDWTGRCGRYRQPTPAPDEPLHLTLAGAEQLTPARRLYGLRRLLNPRPQGLGLGKHPTLPKVVRRPCECLHWPASSFVVRLTQPCFSAFQRGNADYSSSDHPDRCSGWPATWPAIQVATFRPDLGTALARSCDRIWRCSRVYCGRRLPGVRAISARRSAVVPGRDGRSARWPRAGRSRPLRGPPDSPETQVCQQVPHRTRFARIRPWQ
jgi:hypothetical protein